MSTLAFCNQWLKKILLDQARQGHQTAFAQLIEGHSEKMIALAWRLVGQREEAEETATQMKQVLNQLPARQKGVFVLRYLEGLSLKEISHTLGVEEGTVKAHLHRAVSLFRKEFRYTREESS